MSVVAESGRELGVTTADVEIELAARGGAVLRLRYTADSLDTIEKKFGMKNEFLFGARKAKAFWLSPLRYVTFMVAAGNPTVDGVPANSWTVRSLLKATNEDELALIARRLDELVDEFCNNVHIAERKAYRR